MFFFFLFALEMLRIGPILKDSPQCHIRQEAFTTPLSCMLSVSFSFYVSHTHTNTHTHTYTHTHTPIKIGLRVS